MTVWALIALGVFVVAWVGIAELRLRRLEAAAARWSSASGVDRKLPKNH